MTPTCISLCYLASARVHLPRRPDGPYTNHAAPGPDMTSLSALVGSVHHRTTHALTPPTLAPLEAPAPPLYALTKRHVTQPSKEDMPSQYSASRNFTCPIVLKDTRRHLDMPRRLGVDCAHWPSVTGSLG